MRKIKYRAWHKAEKKMYQVVDMYFGRSGELQSVKLLADHNDMQYPTDDIPVNEIQLMQYTGIEDISGKEICEGDYIKAYIEAPRSYCNPDDNVHLIPGKVFFHSGCFLFGDYYCFDTEYLAGIEVIGNIYENPELLGK